MLVDAGSAYVAARVAELQNMLDKFAREDEGARKLDKA